MSIYSEYDSDKAERLSYHEGHEVEVTSYANGASVVIECLTCGATLIEFSSEEDEFA